MKGTVLMGLTTDEVQGQLSRLYLSKMPGKKRLSITDCTDTSGWESRVFSFTLNYEEDNEQRSEPLFLKLYPGSEGVNKAIGEYYSLQQLAFAGYPVPKAMYMGLEEDPFGKPYVIMEKVNGQLLLDVLQTSLFDEQQELVQLFCLLFVELHDLDWQPFVIDPERYQLQGFIQRTLSEKTSLIAQRCPNRFDPVLAWLYERGQEVTCEHFSILHQDYHPGNIILKDDGTAFVIDWTQAEVSDYRFDLAWTLLLIDTFGRSGLRESVLQGYEYYAGYQIPHLDFFEVAICLKRLFDMVVAFDNASEVPAFHSAQTMRMQYIRSFRAALALLQARTGIILPEIASLCDTL